MGQAFIHGLILAFGLILPIGVQNGFVLTQGSLHRRFSGVLPTVITASICDTFLIGVSVLGVTTLAWTSTVVRLIMGVVGLVFLAVMGWTVFKSASQVPARSDVDDETSQNSANPWSVKRQVISAASTSLLNPHAWMDTLAIIGGSAIVYPYWGERIAFGLACVIVSWVWFLALAIVGHVAGTRLLGGRARGWLNRGSAIMMWASGVYLAVVLWRGR